MMMQMIPMFQMQMEAGGDQQLLFDNFGAYGDQEEDPEPDLDGEITGEDSEDVEQTDSDSPGGQNQSESIPEHLHEQLSVDTDTVHELVLSFLAFHCHTKTLAALQQHGEPSTSQPKLLLSERQETMRLVKAGEINTAMVLVGKCTPALFDALPDLEFALLAQVFIELVRAGKLEDAVVFGQQSLAVHPYARTGAGSELMKDLLTLLVYPTASLSPVAHFLHQDRRDSLALRLSEAMLASSSKKIPAQEPLQRLIQHVTVLHSELQKGNPQRPQFHLGTFLRQSPKKKTQ
eukprot:TRINITY_DN8506_c0_g1_i1.p1 TRINITY_DN8506_c0_g1~~TRINITY_DN8506_c0_g1_i1.p1  ORF type:complete len:319 (-),score=70.84 TRINITY_DN8506_c0_g1_i1:8-877(-)